MENGYSDQTLRWLAEQARSKIDSRTSAELK